jgi:hypothetical protein
VGCSREVVSKARKLPGQNGECFLSEPLNKFGLAPQRRSTLIRTLEIICKKSRLFPLSMSIAQRNRVSGGLKPSILEAPNGRASIVFHLISSSRVNRKSPKALTLYIVFAFSSWFGGITIKLTIHDVKGSRLDHRRGAQHRGSRSLSGLKSLGTLWSNAHPPSRNRRTRGKIPVSVNARKDSIEIHHLMPIYSPISKVENS